MTTRLDVQGGSLQGGVVSSPEAALTRGEKNNKRTNQGAFSKEEFISMITVADAHVMVKCADKFFISEVEANVLPNAFQYKGMLEGIKQGNGNSKVVGNNLKIKEAYLNWTFQITDTAELQGMMPNSVRIGWYQKKGVGQVPTSAFCSPEFIGTGTALAERNPLKMKTFVTLQELVTDLSWVTTLTAGDTWYLDGGRFPMLVEFDPSTPTESLGISNGSPFIYFTMSNLIDPAVMVFKARWLIYFN